MESLSPVPDNTNLSQLEEISDRPEEVVGGLKRIFQGYTVDAEAFPQVVVFAGNFTASSTRYDETEAQRRQRGNQVEDNIRAANQMFVDRGQPSIAARLRPILALPQADILPALLALIAEAVQAIRRVTR